MWQLDYSAIFAMLFGHIDRQILNANPDANTGSQDYNHYTHQTFLQNGRAAIKGSKSPPICSSIQDLWL